MKNRQWLFLAVLTLMVVVMWVAVSAWGSFRRSTIPPDIEAIMAPLNPNIDRSVFTRLEQREP